jgi:predicted porin
MFAAGLLVALIAAPSTSSFAQAPPVVVSAAGDLEVELKGFVRFDAQWITQDAPLSKPGAEFFDRVHSYRLTASLAPRKNIRYGFGTGLATGRAAIFLSGPMGRVDLGNVGPAHRRMAISGRSAMVGTGTWSGGGAGLVSLGLNSGTGRLSAAGGGGTARYLSPAIGPLRFSVSYTEQSDSDGIDGSGSESSEDIVAFGGRVTGDSQGMRAAIYAGYEKSNNAAGAGGDRTDQSIFAAGILLTDRIGRRRDGFRLGAGYGLRVDERHIAGGGVDQRTEWFDLGLSFYRGRLALAFGGMHQTDAVPLPGGVADTAFTALSAGFSFNMAPRLRLQGGVSYFEIENAFFEEPFAPMIDLDAGRDNDAVTATLSTVMFF